MQRSTFLLAAVAAVLLLAGGAAACVGTGVTVKNTGMKTALPVNTSNAFDLDGVKQHFASIAPFDEFKSNVGSTFYCVDSRGEYNELGTPGGDIAELSGAITVFFNQTGTKVTDEIVRDILDAFVERHASPSRPFYYHTSDDKLRKVFNELESKGVKPKPTVFPETMPTDQKLADTWLEALSVGSLQGCGHMRLLIDQYKDFGLTSPEVPRALVRAFFSYWWPTPPHSTKRGRMKMTVVQGPLDGHAVAIVDSTGCPGMSPALPPSHGGSQLFIYHAQAVDDFRKSVLTPFFVEYAGLLKKQLDQTKFYNELKSLQAQQLAAVLKYLAPANALPIWSVTIAADGSDTPSEPEPSRNTAPNLANPAGRPSNSTSSYRLPASTKP
ncbi:hypothetical protein Rsub_00899 [Raphidocelis subcapitata]|uniref:Uncharacterized protein n=1 Tax=Raphidocelis subcapitata TaxID=307507 RepID=A0A2V0NTD2_9CHLO|nr:hypothetical protein Rsub_00899 [Raphidocelis subcapitata]|eukprot:GBF88187.1 hypothetical protein Rsub_00899 [Raphidocelis subcapitata]